MLVSADITIEVFATNVERKVDVAMLCGLLQKHFPHCKVNFDLNDKDKILRVAGAQIVATDIVKIVRNSGFHCVRLE